MLIWLSVAMAFLLVEAFTVSLYGLVIAIGCLAAAAVAYFMGDVYHWYQVVVCLLVVSLGSYSVPRIFHRTGVPLQTGLDAYIGKKTVIKIVDWKPKVTLDGVDRLVHSDEELSDGQSVTITGRDGTVLIVS